MLVTPVVIDGTTVLVEVEEQRFDPSAGALQGQGSLQNADKAIKRLADFGESLRATCIALHRAMKKATEEIEPEEMELEFGLKLGGEAGVPFVAKGTAEANFAVRLKWTFHANGVADRAVVPGPGQSAT